MEQEPIPAALILGCMVVAGLIVVFAYSVNWQGLL
jgi:hypothetical protein